MISTSNLFVSNITCWLQKKIVVPNCQLYQIIKMSHHLTTGGWGAPMTYLFQNTCRQYLSPLSLTWSWIRSIFESCFELLTADRWCLQISCVLSLFGVVLRRASWCLEDRSPWEKKQIALIDLVSLLDATDMCSAKKKPANQTSTESVSKIRFLLLRFWRHLIGILFRKKQANIKSKRQANARQTSKAPKEIWAPK